MRFVHKGGISPIGLLLLIFPANLLGRGGVNEDDEILEEVIPRHVYKRKIQSVQTVSKRGSPKRGLLLPGLSQKLALQSLRGRGRHGSALSQVPGKRKSLANFEGNPADAQGNNNGYKITTDSEELASNINNYGLWEYALDNTIGGLDSAAKQYLEKSFQQQQQANPTAPGNDVTTLGDNGGSLPANKLEQLINIGEEMGAGMGGKISVEGDQNMDQTSQQILHAANELNAQAAQQQTGTQMVNDASSQGNADATGQMQNDAYSQDVTGQVVNAQGQIVSGPASSSPVSVVTVPNALTIEDEHGNMIGNVGDTAGSHHNQINPQLLKAMMLENPKLVGRQSKLLAAGLGGALGPAIGNALGAGMGGGGGGGVNMGAGLGGGMPLGGAGGLGGTAALGSAGTLAGAAGLGKIPGLGATNGADANADLVSLDSEKTTSKLLKMLQQGDDSLFGNQGGTAEDATPQNPPNRTPEPSEKISLNDLKLLKVIKQLGKSTHDTEAKEPKPPGMDALNLLLNSGKQKPKILTDSGDDDIKVTNGKETKAEANDNNDQESSQIQALIDGVVPPTKRPKQSMFFDPDQPLGDPYGNTNDLMSYLEQETQVVDQFQEGNQLNDPKAVLSKLARLLIRQAEHNKKQKEKAKAHISQEKASNELKQATANSPPTPDDKEALNSTSYADNSTQKQESTGKQSAALSTDKPNNAVVASKNITLKETGKESSKGNEALASLQKPATVNKPTQPVKPITTSKITPDLLKMTDKAPDKEKGNDEIKDEKGNQNENEKLEMEKGNENYIQRDKDNDTKVIKNEKEEVHDMSAPTAKVGRNDEESKITEKLENGNQMSKESQHGEFKEIGPTKEKENEREDERVSQLQRNKEEFKGKGKEIGNADDRVDLKTEEKGHQKQNENEKQRVDESGRFQGDGRENQRENEKEQHKGQEIERQQGGENNRQRGEDSGRQRADDSGRQREDDSERQRGDDSGRQRGDDSGRQRGEEQDKQQGDDKEREKLVHEMLAREGHSKQDSRVDIAENQNSYSKDENRLSTYRNKGDLGDVDRGEGRRKDESYESKQDNRFDKESNERQGSYVHDKEGNRAQTDNSLKHRDDQNEGRVYYGNEKEGTRFHDDQNNRDRNDGEGRSNEKFSQDREDDKSKLKEVDDKASDSRMRGRLHEHEDDSYSDNKGTDTDSTKDKPIGMRVVHQHEVDAPDSRYNKIIENGGSLRKPEEADGVREDFSSSDDKGSKDDDALHKGSLDTSAQDRLGLNGNHAAHHKSPYKHPGLPLDNPHPGELPQSSPEVEDLPMDLYENSKLLNTQVSHHTKARLLDNDNTADDSYRDIGQELPSRRRKVKDDKESPTRDYGLHHSSLQTEADTIDHGRGRHHVHHYDDDDLTQRGNVKPEEFTKEKGVHDNHNVPPAGVGIPMRTAQRLNTKSLLMDAYKSLLLKRKIKDKLPKPVPGGLLSKLISYKLNSVGRAIDLSPLAQLISLAKSKQRLMEVTGSKKTLPTVDSRFRNPLLPIQRGLQGIGPKSGAPASVLLQGAQSRQGISASPEAPQAPQLAPSPLLAANNRRATALESMVPAAGVPSAVAQAPPSNLPAAARNILEKSPVVKTLPSNAVLGKPLPPGTVNGIGNNSNTSAFEPFPISKSLELTKTLSNSVDDKNTMTPGTSFMLLQKNPKGLEKNGKNGQGVDATDVTRSEVGRKPEGMTIDEVMDILGSVDEPNDNAASIKGNVPKPPKEKAITDVLSSNLLSSDKRTDHGGEEAKSLVRQQQINNAMKRMKGNKDLTALMLRKRSQLFSRGRSKHQRNHIVNQ